MSWSPFYPTRRSGGLDARTGHKGLHKVEHSDTAGFLGDPGDISGEAGGHTAHKEEGMLSSSKLLTGKGHAAVA